MKKIKFSILILFSNLLLLLFSCNIQDLRCNSKDDNTIIHNQTIAFTYQSNTEEFIDINNDQINDFKCISERAGNRIRKLIVPIGTENKIISTDKILGIGKIIDKHKTFSDRFDFNDLGAGSNAHLDHKFI